MDLLIQLFMAINTTDISIAYKLIIIGFFILFVILSVLETKLQRYNQIPISYITVLKNSRSFSGWLTMVLLVAIWKKYIIVAGIMIWIICKVSFHYWQSSHTPVVVEIQMHAPVVVEIQMHDPEAGVIRDGVSHLPTR